jgi:hypothetical protein
MRGQATAAPGRFGPPRRRAGRGEQLSTSAEHLAQIQINVFDPGGSRLASVRARTAGPSDESVSPTVGAERTAQGADATRYPTVSMAGLL